MQLHPSGPRACLVDVPNPEAAHSLAVWIRQRCPDIGEVVPAAETVLFDGVNDLASLSRELDLWEPGATSDTGTSVLTIPVVYDGPDLAAVATHWGVTAADVVTCHTSIEFVAAFCGFSPGFAYLAGLPQSLAVPRLSTPRTRVPTGAVAIADAWCAVYPSPSPGGWLILGTTAMRMWDQSKTAPARISPGTGVRFTEATS